MGNGNPGNRSQQVSIKLNQSTATLAPGQTAQFTATVTGTTNTAVTWTVDNVNGGDSAHGTISSLGLYTAPQSAGTHTVTATSVADNTKSASAAVTVQGNVGITPASATVIAGATEQFQATVNGQGNSSVTWSVDGVGGGNATVGTISNSGLYTAPPQPGNHTISASVGSKAVDNASAAVTVFTFGISPNSVSLPSGSTQQFTASVQGLSNASVTWSVDGVAGGNATTGTVSATGLYTAPAQSGTHTVTATSAADTSARVSATVAVGGSFSISPTSATIITGAMQQFTASIQGISNPTITWSVDNIAGGNSTVGTISTSGLYTAPSQVGNHTISANDGSASVTAQLTVFSFVVTPNGAVLSPGGTQQFTATIQGLTNNSVTWSVDGIPGGNGSSGTISASGLYSAPSALGSHTVSAASVADPSDVVNSRVTVTNVSQSAVLTYHNDDARDGAYLNEVTLTPQNVNSTQFGKVYSYHVDGQIYGQPLYLPQLNINGGTHDVVFVATQNNTVYAFDADASAGSGTTFWSVNFGTPKNAYDDAGPWPVVGILSTPVIDATSNTIYVVTHQENTTPEYWLHALDVTTGKDRVNPMGIQGSSGSDYLGRGCYQRMGLALDPVTNLIYLPVGSCPSGWVLAYDKTTLQQKAVFDATPNAGGGGFWGSGAAPAIDDSTGELYLMNGVDAGDQQWIGSSSMTGYNDCFLRMDPTNLSVLDYFAPDNNYALASSDADLGSGGNVLVPGSSSYPHELLGGGKDGNVFVINRDSMGGYNNQSNNVLQTVHTGTSQYDNIFSTPVYWNGLVYIHPNNDVLHAFSWNASAAAGQQLSSQPVANGPAYFGQHGATPSLSANGNNNGIIWEIDNSTYNNTDPTKSGAAVLHAYDASNVASELYNSTEAGSRDQAGQALKFTNPTIANGRVFVPTATELDIYGLLGQ
ncbi:MAG TPA: Ig-like domain-containing protein [Candidatus Sulfotelmatobacter sp.]|nr:Ig-like domain-containing protein [Candidatus Sulfotelmatobacter sp.]